MALIPVVCKRRAVGLMGLDCSFSGDLHVRLDGDRDIGLDTLDEHGGLGGKRGELADEPPFCWSWLLPGDNWLLPGDDCFKVLVPVTTPGPIPISCSATLAGLRP
mmetsp:Transcript_123774/g.240884  ORF Transcript_123774/g.240884 Transcript_123774/m.240884 type:complete len:105 (+) Transcript_123774:463-777(+)